MARIKMIGDRLGEIFGCSESTIRNKLDNIPIKKVWDEVKLKLGDGKQ